MIACCASQTTGSFNKQNVLACEQEHREIRPVLCWPFIVCNSLSLNCMFWHFARVSFIHSFRYRNGWSLHFIHITIETDCFLSPCHFFISQQIIMKRMSLMEFSMVLPFVNWKLGEKKIECYYFSRKAFFSPWSIVLSMRLSLFRHAYWVRHKTCNRTKTKPKWNSNELNKSNWILVIQVILAWRSNHICV